MSYYVTFWTCLASSFFQQLIYSVSLCTLISVFQVLAWFGGCKLGLYKLFCGFVERTVACWALSCTAGGASWQVTFASVKSDHQIVYTIGGGFQRYFRVHRYVCDKYKYMKKEASDFEECVSNVLKPPSSENIYAIKSLEVLYCFSGMVDMTGTGLKYDGRFWLKSKMWDVFQYAMTSSHKAGSTALSDHFDSQVSRGSKEVTSLAPGTWSPNTSRHFP